MLLVQIFVLSQHSAGQAEWLLKWQYDLILGCLCIVDQWYNLGDRAFVSPLLRLYRHHSNLTICSRMYCHNMGERPLRGNHLFLPQMDYVINLIIPRWFISFWESLKQVQIFWGPPLPKMSYLCLAEVPTFRFRHRSEWSTRIRKRLYWASQLQNGQELMLQSLQCSVQSWLSCLQWLV